ERTWAMVTWPAALHGPEPAATVVRHLFGAAYVVGVAALVSARRWAALAVLCGPLAATLAANVLGHWPYGAFRTHLFLLPSLAVTAAVGLDALAAVRWGRAVAALALVATAVVFWPVDLGYHRVKHLAEDAPSPQLSHVLDDMLARRDAFPHDAAFIVADRHS